MTEDELFQFRDHLIATLDGFVEPAAYAVGVVGPAGVRFPATNVDRKHRLPAAVLAEVLGYRSGTCTLALTTEQLDAAIERLAPAEACTAWDHPNLWAWRDLRTGVAGDARFVVVFIAEPGDRETDAIQAAFRSQAGWAAMASGADDRVS